MILVDQQAGSKDLTLPLQGMGLPVQPLMLKSADIAFEGRGIGGVPLNIGIEHKKLEDLVQSIRTGRLVGEQLPKMLGPLGAYDHGWLVAEGPWRIDPKTGRLQLWHAPRRFKRRGESEWVDARGRMSGAEFQKHLFTLEVIGGLHVHFAPTRQASLQFIASLYRWFTDKDLDQHGSMVAIHRPTGFLPVSECRKTLATLPGIGLHLSAVVEKHFRGKLAAAFTAGPDEWQKIEGIGPKMAHQIVGYIRGQS